MKTSADNITVEQSGAVRRIVLDRPEKLNALTPAMTRAFFAAIDAAMADPGTAAVVISGNGRAFCTGADIRGGGSGEPVKPTAATGLGGEEGGMGNAPVDMVANRSRVENWLRLWSAPKPLIAQVHGYCVGLANEIVGCCDFVVCAESARFGMPEARDFALPPTLGFWPMRVGSARTKELLWTGRLVEGAEAVTIGLADKVVADDRLEAEATELAERIAEVPVARLAVVKQAVNSWAETFGAREAALRGAEYHALFHQVVVPEAPTAG